MQENKSGCFFWMQCIYKRNGSKLTVKQIDALRQSCYFHICQLHCTRLYLDIKITRTIATSIVHSKLDYCNSLYYNLPNSQLKRLQQIQNSVRRAVVKVPKSSHASHFLKSLRQLKINQWIKYKMLSLTIKVLNCLSQIPQNVGQVQYEW